MEDNQILTSIVKNLTDEDLYQVQYFIQDEIYTRHQRYKTDSEAHRERADKLQEELNNYEEGMQ